MRYIDIWRYICNIMYSFFILVHICRRRQTPASTHFEGFSLVLRLNVQMYVWLLSRVLYTGQSYMFRI